jgi:hypothetical protein
LPEDVVRRPPRTAQQNAGTQASNESFGYPFDAPIMHGTVGARV